MKGRDATPVRHSIGVGSGGYGGGGGGNGSGRW